MSVLKCDVCGGALSIDAGGQTATCDFCGAKHSVERMREKVQEIKGTVNITGEVQSRQTGTASDVQQWKELLNKYMSSCDYQSALPVVKKILEAAPSDQDANLIYDQLQELQYFDIRNGILTSYNGKAYEICIPEGVIAIEKMAFKESAPFAYINDYIESIILPDSISGLPEYCFSYCQKLKKVRFGNNLREIHDGAFAFCCGLEEIELSHSIKSIGKEAFNGCRILKEIDLPNGLERIGERAFVNCTDLEEINIPDSVVALGSGSFCNTGIRKLHIPSGITDARCMSGCTTITELDASIDFIRSYRKLYKPNPGTINREYFSVWQETMDKYQKKRRCEYCGGEVSLLSSKCKQCGSVRRWL